MSCMYCNGHNECVLTQPDSPMFDPSTEPTGQLEGYCADQDDMACTEYEEDE